MKAGDSRPSEVEQGRARGVGRPVTKPNKRPMVVNRKRVTLPCRGPAGTMSEIIINIGPPTRPVEYTTSKWRSTKIA